MTTDFYKLNAKRPDLIEICRQAKIRLVEQVFSKNNAEVIIWNRSKNPIAELAKEKKYTSKEIKTELKKPEWVEDL